jgi:hypothetical protein
MKQFVLVAGIDYEFKGVNFRLFANNRLKRMVAKNTAKEDLTFQIFDVKSGEVVTHEFTYPGGKRTETVTRTTPFTALTRANFDRFVVGGETHHRFRDGQSGMMSVTDVYTAVQAIGASDPGTLLELSFFSHAWHGGPLLVNSRDDGQVTGPPGTPGGPPTVTNVGAARDPDDKDPRAVDFMVPRMSGADLTLFQDAYHADGYSWVWGCAFPRVVHEILHKLEHHRDYRSSGLPDTQMFVFTNFRADHILSLHDFLGAVFANPRRVEIEFGELKRYVCRVVQSSYTHHLAVNSNKKTFGGLMGTYSDYDHGRLALMHVVTIFPGHLRFYQNYLGFSLDPEGRRYGEYLPTFTC